MTVIKDGSGTGRTTKVNEENRLDVESVSRSLDQHINELYQKCFSLPFDAIDPVGADDYFVYMKNTGTKNLHITDLRIRSTVAGTVEIRAVSGTPSYTADTDITPVNLSIGSSESLTGTFKTDTNTTGLTNEGVLFYHRLNTVGQEEHLRTSAHIIIPPGQAVALLWDAATGALSGTVSMYEDQGVS
jgi:hypothetical protein